jgi:hypothetical protein
MDSKTLSIWRNYLGDYLKNITVKQICHFFGVFEIRFTVFNLQGCNIRLSVYKYKKKIEEVEFILPKLSI